jgi:hypothetical protein
MKALVIGNFTLGWDGSICDEEHIAQALDDLGHEVTRWQRTSLPLSVEEASKEYDFALIAQWDQYHPGLIAQLHNLTDRVVYWAFDYQEDGQEWHEHLIEGADLYLSKPFKDSKYPNWRWLSQDFSPSFLDKKPDWHQSTVQDIDVLFTGTYVPWESGKERVKYLKAIDSRFNLQINSITPSAWKSEGFKNVHGPVMDDALPDLIARAKVNFSMDHVISPGYWSDRNAQIMCCGGFVLFRHVPMSEAVFHNKIGYFHTIEECLDRIQYFLDVPEDREFMAAEGYKWAQANLKAINRVSDLLVLVASI